MKGPCLFSFGLRHLLLESASGEDREVFLMHELIHLGQDIRDTLQPIPPRAIGKENLMNGVASRLTDQAALLVFTFFLFPVLALVLWRVRARGGGISRLRFAKAGRQYLREGC